MKEIYLDNIPNEIVFDNGASTASDIKIKKANGDQITPISVDNNSHRLTYDDKVGIGILLMLYFFQGLPLGFFLGTIDMILAAKGAKLADLGTLSLAVLPFSLKILFAPLQDIYGLLSIIIGFYIDDLVDKMDIIKLTIIGFFSIGIMALQDIAVDGWALTLLSKENVSYGSTCQSVGQSLGNIFAFNILIPLNSIKFCNEYIYSKPQDTPIITLNGFCIFTGVIIIIANVFIHLLTKETQLDSKHESCCDMLKIFKGFISNPNLRLMIFFHLTWKIGFGPINAVVMPILLQRGFSKDTLTNIDTILKPFQFINSIIVGKISRNKTEFTIWYRCYYLYIFQTIFLYLLLSFTENTSDWTLVTILLFLNSIASIIISNSIFVTIGAFHNRICDPNIGGTFMTTCAAVSNFGGQWVGIGSLFIENYISWTYFGLIGIAFAIVYVIMMKEKVLILQKKDKKEFAVEIKETRKDYVELERKGSLQIIEIMICLRKKIGFAHQFFEIFTV